jgi:hypothetical protein
VLKSIASVAEIADGFALAVSAELPVHRAVLAPRDAGRRSSVELERAFAAPTHEHPYGLVFNLRMA